MAINPEARAGAGLVPVEAGEAVVRAFERYPLVGIGELHGNVDVHDVVLTLVRDERFAGRVDDVVVEFGNAAHQRTVDRYVAGEDVPVEQLRLAWRDTVNPLTWDSPVYERFYRAVREANLRRRPERQLRVVLGDVPVDWARVTRMADLGASGSRDVHYAGVVEREVLAKGRRALLVAGQWHLYKRNPSVEDVTTIPDQERNTAEILLRKHPGKLLVIQPADFGRGAGEVERQFAGWKKGDVVMVRDTSLGATDFGTVTPFRDKTKYVDGRRVDLPDDAPFAWPRVDEVTDAYLWLGPKESHQYQKPEPTTYDDAAYLAELRRRARLMGYPAQHFRLMTGKERDGE